MRVGARATARPGSTGAPSYVCPGPAARRAAHARDAHAHARGDPGARRHGRSPRATPASRTRIPRSAGSSGRSDPRPASARPRSPRRACRRGAAVGLTGLERQFDARLRRHPGRHAATPARACSPRASRSAGARCARRSTSDVQKAAVDALAGPLRRHRRRAAARRRGAGARGHRLLGAAAAGLDVQDRHAGGRAAGRHGDPRGDLSRADGGHAGGRRAGQTPTARPAAGRSSRPSPSRATPSSRRWAPGSAPSASSRRRSASASTSGRRSIGAARSTIPPAAEIGDDLAVGSSAIGQGKVLATPLLMATVAAAIGERGVRPLPTLSKGQPSRQVRATSAAAARTIRRYMRAVVRSGTGVGSGAARHSGRRQDGHGRAAHDGPGPAAGDPTGRAAAAAAGRRRGHRRVVCGVRPRGAPARGASRCCWSAKAPAARRPRRPLAR